MGRALAGGLLGFLVTIVAIGGPGCGGGGGPASATGHGGGPLPPATTFAATEAKLAGHRCTTPTTCTGRAQGDTEETTPPAEGTKRFEVRLTVTGGKGWLAFGDHKLVKATAVPEECWYLDVTPGGDVPVSLNVVADAKSGGAGVSLRVREYKAEGAAWYDAFKWQCGDPEACSLEALDELKAAVTRDRKLLRDSCSSVRPNGVTWESGRAPDATHPEDVRLQAKLFVAKWTPTEPPETPSCPEK